MPQNPFLLGRVSMSLPLRPVLVLVLLALLAGVAHGQARAAPLLQALRTLAEPLRSAADLEPLLGGVGGAGVVLLGEASHGTHEFYAWRDRLSRRLVAERGFDFVAIEGDWASLVPLDRYVRHHPDDLFIDRYGFIEVPIHRVLPPPDARTEQRIHEGRKQ